MRILRMTRRLTLAVVLAFALVATTTATATAAAAAPARPASLPPIGSTLCHSGPTTGWQCGTLTGTNLTISYPGGVVYGVFRYTACSGPRDQGAPIFDSSGTQVGTILASSGSCAYGGVTYGLP